LETGTNGSKLSNTEVDSKKAVRSTAETFFFISRLVNWRGNCWFISFSIWKVL